MTVIPAQNESSKDSSQTVIIPSANYCVLKEATILPMLPGSTPLSINGGIVHDDLHEEYYQYRGAPIDEKKTQLDLATHINLFTHNAVKPRKLDGIFVYGGPIFNNFGHFIAECVHRCWAYEFAQSELNLHVDKVVFTPQVRRRFSWFRAKTYKLPPVYIEIMNYLGIPTEKIRCTFSPETVKTLVVGQQASYFRGKTKSRPAYLAFLERCYAKASVSHTSTTHKKLYVSRRDFSLRGAYAGEQYIQNFLEEQGFQPYYPEQHCITSQLSTYKQAQEIIFAEGSAVHVLELLGELKASVSVICRRSRSRALFEPILSARINTLHFMTDVITLPSLFFTPNAKNGANGSAISVLNTKALVTFLGASHKLDTDTFNQSKFSQAVKNDVRAYLSHYSQNIDEKQPHKLTAIKKFEEACLKHLNWQN